MNDRPYEDAYQGIRLERGHGRGVSGEAQSLYAGVLVGDALLERIATALERIAEQLEARTK